MKRITKSWLVRQQACADQVAQFAKLWPEGMPLTRANALICHKAGLDVVWAACRLMSIAQRRELIVFTLKQRQSCLVTLFDRAGLASHAQAIAVLDFSDLTEAERVFDAAWAASDAAWAVRTAASDAAWAAARDAQSEFCLTLLGVE